MFSEPAYRQTPTGQYVYLVDNQETGPYLNEVALCFDHSCGTLHKHGSPESVNRWYADARKRLTTAGYPDMADELLVIQGPFPLEELNRMLQVSGYAKRYFDEQVGCPA